MTEDQIQRVESELDAADAPATAAIAFASICRLGELGKPALDGFTALIPSQDDPEFFEQYHRGIDLIHSLTDGRYAREASLEVPLRAK